MTIPAETSVLIEAVTPQVDDGRYPVKRTVGETFEVCADVISHGHDVVRAVLRYRHHEEPSWREVEMESLGNDRWRGEFRLEQNTTYRYTIFAWRDPFHSWLQSMEKKRAAGVELLPNDVGVGAALIAAAIERADPDDARRLDELLGQIAAPTPNQSGVQRAIAAAEALLIDANDRAVEPPQVESLIELLRGLHAPGADPARPLDEVIFSAELHRLMGRYPDRSAGGSFDRELAVFADRQAAEFSAWYEMWPRSQGTDPNRSATFDEMRARLAEIDEMGFSVVYLPPIHPIGYAHRKGPNNALDCPPGSPGCPYAIGNADGGHMAIEPGLGTIDDFRRFEAACRDRGMEVALDLALQCSPDHPWVAKHPEWFIHRPDGTIQYAENPPKQYQDIYPLNFDTADREGLWRACLEIVHYWIGEGVKIFRVDNPHTKPVQFWRWLIGEVQREHPEVFFLAEAFTRPKMMRALAKAGFAQSYTYFTWRNFKAELREYFEELTSAEMANVMRGNLFTNTPDILPGILQGAPRAAFQLRAVLAATLSSTWGIYNGFELCEGTALPGREEYKDSEKYQFKVWDWNRPGNIKRFIGRLNGIRAQQPALRRYRGLRFFEIDSDNLLAYGKVAGDNVILIVVNLDPYQAHEGTLRLPLDELGVKADATYQLHDLLNDKRYFWRGAENYVRLDPEEEVAHIFKLLRWSHREQSYDYYL